MSSATLIALASSASFIASVLVSVFVTGSKWGELRSDVKNIEKNLAKIEGMFALKLKD